MKILCHCMTLRGNSPCDSTEQPSDPVRWRRQPRLCPALLLCRLTFAPNAQEHPRSRLLRKPAFGRKVTPQSHWASEGGAPARWIPIPFGLAKGFMLRRCPFFSHIHARPTHIYQCKFLQIRLYRPIQAYTIATSSHGMMPFDSVRLEQPLP